MKTDGIGIIEEVKQFIREPYAWPGNYPKLLVMGDGGCLCAKCAHENVKEVFYDTMHAINSGWHSVGVMIHYEGEAIQCDHCSVLVESAYGPIEAQ